MRNCARAYLTLPHNEPKAIVVVDAARRAKVVAERIWAAVEHRLHPGLERLAAETAAP